MLNILMAGLGGFVGSILRYLLNLYLYQKLNYPVFPYGTLLINVSGCLFIGFLSGLMLHHDIFTPEIKIFIFVGILGGYTTYSSFGFETFYLYLNGHYMLALLNVLAQLLFGLVAVGLGFYLAQKLKHF